MANYMAEVAKMLGVELDEKFKIKHMSGGISDCYYYFTNFGLCSENNFYSDGPELLTNLLIGNYTILKKPWKPRGNEKYWYVTPEGYCCDAICLGDWVNLTLYKIGNCYRTKEEAESNRDKWVEFYKSDEVLEI